MELKILRHFITVVEAGSVSRAAAALYVAQPALSAQMKRLEDELGAQLLVRSHLGVEPTAAGLELLQQGRRLLADAAAIQERFRHQGQMLRGTVAVAFPAMLAELLIGPILAAVQARHPGIEVFVIDDFSLAIQRAVLDGRADFGLLVDPQPVDGLRQTPLVEEPVFFCGVDAGGRLRSRLRPPEGDGAATETLDRVPTIAFADAIRQPLVLQSRRFAIRRHVDEQARALGLPEVIPVHEQDSANVIRSLTSCGAGYSFSPACAARTRSRDPDWLCARVVEPGIQRTYALAHISGRALDAAAEAVRAAVVEEAHRAIVEQRWVARWIDPEGSSDPA